MGKGIVKLGEGNWAVKDGNLLAAKETNGRFKNAEFTVTRGTDATYVGKDGLIANETGDDTPRIDFTDNTDGHLLLEPQSTNLIDYSESFESPKWSRNGFDSDYGHQSPTGLNTATKITATSTDPYIYKDVNVTQNQTYTFSFYCKGEGSSVGKTGRVLFWYGNATATGSFASHEFNLTNGWERIQFQTTPTGSGALTFRIDIPANTSEVGDVAYIWGAQVEALSYPTSYIPTSGLQVTRDAETCTGAGEAADFNSEEGVLYAEIARSTVHNDYELLSISPTNNSDGTHYASLGYNNTDNKLWIRAKIGNTVAIASIGEVDTVLNQFYKIAIKYKSGENAIYVNGEKLINTDITDGSEATTFTPTQNTISDLEFRHWDANQPFYGKVKAIRVYKDASIDLATLTS